MGLGWRPRLRALEHVGLKSPPGEAPPSTIPPRAQYIDILKSFAAFVAFLEHEAFADQKRPELALSDFPI